MSRAYATPLRLDIQPHSGRKYLYLVLLVFSQLSLLLANISLWLKLVLVPLVVLVLYRDYQARKKSFGLIWQQGNHWILLMDNQAVAAQLQKGSFNSGFLMVLNFALDNGGHKALLFSPCETEADTYRRLRVRFKVEGGKIFR